jgi:hypothetical protein
LIYGHDCVQKARACGEMILERVERAGFKLEKTLIECLGAGDAVPTSPSFPIPQSPVPLRQEVMLRVSAHDPRREALERFAKEFAPPITSGPPGIAGYAAGRPQVRPVFAYWPTLVTKKLVPTKVKIRPAAAW